MSQGAITVNRVLTDLHFPTLSCLLRKMSGILDDANQWDAWADDPYELVLHLQRLVRISVETTRIVNELPRSLSN